MLTLNLILFIMIDINDFLKNKKYGLMLNYIEIFDIYVDKINILQMLFQNFIKKIINKIFSLLVDHSDINNMQYNFNSKA